jgi:hypothetical protein
MATGQEDSVISTTPADTTSTDTTHVGRIPLTSTWFHLVGLRPYQLLGLADRTTGPRNPVRPLPRLDLAA